MTGRWWICTLTLTMVAPFALSQVGCGGDDTSQQSGDGGGDAGDDGSGGDGAIGDGATGDGHVAEGGEGSTCLLTGQTCAGDVDCCSASCDTQMHICVRPVGVCKQAGAACVASNECCTFVCDQGRCGSQLCITDHQACTTSSSCCGGVCSGVGTDAGGACTPLSGSCKTSGNACQQNGDCCSSLCTNGRCSSQVSFCTQTGDVCSTNTECCGGICTKQGANTLGLCTVPQVTGTPQCALAGDLCGAGVDGGTNSDGGVPACGGSCCSRSCAPYGPTGADICQPPSGCRPTGELCRVDNDCCGAPGTPTGGADSNVHCSKANVGDPVGRCDNGNVCSPAGNICKLATTSCNASDRCCAGTVQTHPYLCKQDLLGIPRCTITGLCPDSGTLQGQACASSADCCGLACVPNPNQNPPFVCGAACVSQCGGCTTSADCCPGVICELPPGSSSGTCGGPCGSPDGGTSADGGGNGDGGGTTTDAGSCALYGQLCSNAGDCCDGVPCTSGRCTFPIR